MHLYNIGYHTDESREFTLLSFERKLAKEELAMYVHQATHQVLRDYLKGRPKNIPDQGPLFSEIYLRVIEELKRSGFEPVSFDGEWSAHGWTMVCDKDDAMGSDLDTKLLVESIPDDLRKKVLGKQKAAEKKRK